MATVTRFYQLFWVMLVVCGVCLFLYSRTETRSYVKPVAGPSIMHHATHDQKGRQEIRKTRVNISSSIKSVAKERTGLSSCEYCPQRLEMVQTLQDLRKPLSEVIRLESTVVMFNDDRNLSSKCCHQNWRQKKVPTGTRYDEHFHTIKPVRSCAVVGSSGILLHSRCGREIDSHDFVLRVNLPPIKGYEKDVGYRTDFSAVNNIALHGLVLYMKHPENQWQIQTNKYYFDSLLSANNTILWFGYNFTERVYLMNQAKSDVKYLLDHAKDKTNLNFTLAYSMLPVWPRIVKRFWNTTRGTSEGFLAFTVAVLFCEKINIYGFWPFPSSPTGKHISHHYYDKKSRYTRKAVMPRESEILRELNNRGIINMVTSNCRH
ncbi:CMP-N-acetylneuraminate-poly-alpha-2,8-sialyltransferase-like [Ptychodera flava]|uniref:CMP-N-acetylneuraminate-poly-alpha-2, 8-sialyltransferase-like n=1 Tax=Ptychodera flava TaxID=63121 RepID=UPI00396A2B79